MWLERMFEVNSHGETRIAKVPLSYSVRETQQNWCLLACESVSGGEGKLKMGMVYSTT